MFQYDQYPSWISPEVIPGLPVRWYSLMYIVAFAITYLLFRRQVTKGRLSYTVDESLSLILYAITGLILGARLVSSLLYDGTMYYWTHPWMIFWPFRNGVFVGLPGMSYHGGLLGAVVGVAVFSKTYKKPFFEVSDLLVAGIPLGYTFGRLGNFINGELWGRVSTASWAMVFPAAPRFSTTHAWVRAVADTVGMQYVPGAMINLPRHPSQLYEAVFEGVLLWVFLYVFMRKRVRFHGHLLSWYLIGYGFVRFCIEYLREPDSNIGFVLSAGGGSTALFESLFNISMGQILCLLMMLAGVVLLLVLQSQDKRRKAAAKKSNKTTNRRRSR
jgi:phosphatidylglycerol:prolipoprotein diacylglycerol transferase